MIEAIGQWLLDHPGIVIGYIIVQTIAIVLALLEGRWLRRQDDSDN
jgi:hypothetical protein